LEDLNGFAGMVIEDPPGFTPEARRSLAAWTDRGGVVLLAAGFGAASGFLASDTRRV